MACARSRMACVGHVGAGRWKYVRNRHRLLRPAPTYLTRPYVLIYPTFPISK